MSDRPPIPSWLRERVYRKSGERCQRCTAPITLDDFHVAHRRAHAHGGPAIEENLEAWCAACNLRHGATDVADDRVPPRSWQTEALEPVVAQIQKSRVATVSAAPGAGKTLFAGLVFEHVRELGIVERMVVLAPRRTIVEQWVGSLARDRHLELKPDATVERRHAAQQVGVVGTYQSLTRERTLEHREQAAARRTLVVLDEVHHVGEPASDFVLSRPAWAQRVSELCGTVDRDLHVAAVLNLSGTLWRSDASQRISTVRYEALPNGRFVSVVDYDVDAQRLIAEGQLRPVDIFRQGARVELADLRLLEIIDSHTIDLSERQQRVVVARLGSDAAFRRAFIAAVLDRLEQAHRSLDRAPVKALIVAARQVDARAMQETADELMQARGLRPITALAISDDPDAARVLKRFRAERQVGVLCTCDMAGEGYDCPDIVVIGFASDKQTPLYIRQVVARAQRVTELERRRAQPIPATVVVPDLPGLVELVSSILVPMHHEVAPAPELPPPGPPPGPRPGPPPLPEIELRNVRPDLHLQARAVGVEDSDVDGAAIAQLEPILEANGVPPVYATRIYASTRRAAKQHRAENPFTPPSPDAAAQEAWAANARPAPRDDPEARARRRATTEDLALAIQRSLHELEGWWKRRGDEAVPVNHFARDVNVAAGIPGRGGRGTASVPQLVAAYRAAQQRIRAFCATHPQRQPPRFHDWSHAE